MVNIFVQNQNYNNHTICWNCSWVSNWVAFTKQNVSSTTYTFDILVKMSPVLAEDKMSCFVNAIWLET